MAGKVKTLVQEKLTPVIEKLGYEVVDIEYSKESNGMNLVFYIDCDAGVTIDDCEKVSKVIDPLLDELNPTDDQPYIMSVSSPGIDRPLKTDRDFNRHIGKEIEITLFSKLDGKKNFKGELVSFDTTSVTIKTEGKGEQNITLSRDKIAHIVPIIKF